ncbi:MAG: hypothetical protein E7487_03165 [Ruminococcaceae bacterium]|nr:hypothetical protein [Oscillospiraceae bacterium]
MFQFLKNSKKLSLLLSLAFGLMLAGAGVAGVFLDIESQPAELVTYSSSETSKEESSESSSSQSSEVSESEPESAESSESEPEESQPQPEFVPISKKDIPLTMRAVMLRPGEDFLTGSLTRDAVVTEIDAALAAAAKLSMNTVIVELDYLEHVIYKSSYVSTVSMDFDVFEYLLTSAKKAGMYVYAVFDVLNTNSGAIDTKTAAVNSSVLDLIYENTKEFAAKYSVDGIILDGYLEATAEKSGSYMEYISSGGGTSFTDYRYDITYSVLSKAIAGIAASDPSINVGLLTSPVWANSSSNESGSATSADYEMMYDSFADVRQYIINHMFDFIAVEAPGSLTDPNIPFASVITWWSALTSEADIPLYAIQAADRVGTKNVKGWEKPDQLAQQLIEVDDLPSFSGSIFNSLTSLQTNEKSTEKLMEFFENGTVSEEFILKELEISKPQKKAFETSDVTFTFIGASDPSEDVTLNGEVIPRDKNGAFSVTVDLAPGLNEFTFAHQDKTLTYKITRNIVIIKEVQPTGNITVDGNMQIEVSVIAYQDSAVSAALNGVSINLTASDAQEDESLRDTSYVKYIGTFTAPAATSSQQNLGNIKFTAKYGDKTETKQGAAVSVNKKVELVEGNGNVVEVTADYCETYPANTLDNSHESDCYPLAKGTRDYISGDPVVYKDGNTSYSYYVLQSGQRVATSDVIKLDSSVTLGNNTISSLTVSSDARYTKVILATEQHVAYKFKYSASAVTIDFKYTTTVPKSLTNLTKNPLFSAATWSGTTLTLKFNTTHGFLGYTAYYESGNLVFRFINPPSNGLAGSVIVVDPGHSSVDPGALGFLDDYPEQVINQMVSRKLTAVLQSRGANVYMINTQNGATPIQGRITYATSCNPHVYISIHCNSAANASASGSESWYYNGFSGNLASKVSSYVSSSYSTKNRGKKHGYFYVTRFPMFASTLAELGFVTNTDDYYKLLKENVQQNIAEAIANALADYLTSVCGGYRGRTGVESTDPNLIGSQPSTPGNNQQPGNQQPSIPDNNQQSSSGDSSQQQGSQGDSSQNSQQSSGGESSATPITELLLKFSIVALTEGDTLQMTVSSVPADAPLPPLVWTSSDPTIATVDSSGLITAHKAGTVTITVSSADGSLSASCTIVVRAAE